MSPKPTRPTKLATNEHFLTHDADKTRILKDVMAKTVLPILAEDEDAYYVEIELGSTDSYIVKLKDRMLTVAIDTPLTPNGSFLQEGILSFPDDDSKVPHASIQEKVTHREVNFLLEPDADENNIQQVHVDSTLRIIMWKRADSKPKIITAQNGKGN